MGGTVLAGVPHRAAAAVLPRTSSSKRPEGTPDPLASLVSTYRPQEDGRAPSRGYGSWLVLPPSECAPRQGRDSFHVVPAAPRPLSRLGLGHSTSSASVGNELSPSADAQGTGECSLSCSLTAQPSRLASPLRPLFPFLPPPPPVSTPPFPGSCGLLVESPELQGRRLTENPAWGRHQLTIALAPATVGFCPEAEHVPLFHRDPTRADRSWGG